MTIPRVVRAGYAAAFLLAAPMLHAQKPDSARLDSAASIRPTTLIGKVTDSTGVGLPGAEITLLKSDRVHAITGDSGDFRINGLVPGTVTFAVRRIGFEAATFTAVLKPGRIQRARFNLTATAQALPTVAVSDTTDKTHWLDQFERRRSNAGRGTFITRDEILKHGARTGVDVIRMVAGVRIQPLRNGLSQVIMTRGAGARNCIPQLFIHNMPYSGTMDDFIAEDIEAVEVYSGISEIPPELDKNGKGICAAIVVWTRDPRKPPD
ncbi:MAG TPA: carboxypeptidase regulatory-like domain-containing protein [Gemmatimonadaceae bacterium]|nr:carboxypeptidase regulatory-like domain-containing protein [Gemmatimonadaceae bacterium]